MGQAFTDEFIRFVLQLEDGGADDPTLKCSDENIVRPRNLLDYARKYVGMKMSVESVSAQKGYVFSYIDGTSVVANLRKYCGHFFPEIDIGKPIDEQRDVLDSAILTAEDVPTDEIICFCASANVTWFVWQEVRDDWRRHMAKIRKPVGNLPETDEFFEFIECDENAPVIDSLENKPIMALGTASKCQDIIQNAVEKAREIYAGRP